MNNEIIQLEEILNKEIEAYLKLEEYISEKNECLIKNDLEKIKSVDEELTKYNFVIEKLEEKRKQIYPENLTLGEIIKRIENKEHAGRISALREKIKNILNNVSKLSVVNSELLKFSLKIVENSIVVIANALVPEGASYNKKGISRNKNDILNISSVEHEA